MGEPHVDEDNLPNNVIEGPKQKNTILDNFRKLTKNKEKVRTKAGAHLVKDLLDKEESESEQKYALGRLIRGLGSSTVDARCGFYSTLMPLLNFSNFTVDHIMEHVNKELHKGKSNSKSENADICTGQILVCCAIIRSELFKKSSEEDQVKVIQCLLNAGKGRSYLLYPSFIVLLDLIEKLNKETFKTLILPLIQPELEKPWAEYNLDLLYLLIILGNKYPKVIGNNILKKTTGNSQLLTSNNLEDLSNILMNIPRIAALQHPVYEAFSKILVKTELTTDFIGYIDNILAKYNKNKHLVTIRLVTYILQNTESPNDVPLFLEQSLIQQTLTVFRQLRGGEKDNELKQLTHKLFDAILDVLKKEEVREKTKISVLKKLLFSPGTFIFEKITKSKLVQQITGVLKADGVKKLAKLYREVIMLQNEKFNSDSTENFQNNDRLYAAHLLVKLMGHSTMHDENNWKFEQLKFLMHLGLSKQPKVGVELASSLKETFYRSLDLKLPKLDDLSNILVKIFQELDSLISEDSLETSLRSPIAPETYTTWSKAKSLITKIESKKTKKVKLVFQILFLHLGLQLFNDVKLARDSLEELFSCYERIKKEKHSDNEDDPAWIEVVVELFLSLLSHNSHLLRRVITCVFPHLCKYLNATAVHQVLSVLDPNNEDNPLTNKNEISDDESQSSEDENGLDEEESEDNESDEEMSEGEDMEESNNDKLRRALHEALMQNMEGNQDESDIDLDQLDEEQGEKLNKNLAEVFKQFKPNLGKMKKQKKDDETLTHFRVRVLDLIEIYLDSNPSMILTLEIMLPLLQTLEFSIKDDHQKPLNDRVKSCLKKLANIKKFGDISGVTDKTLCDILESLLEKGTKSTLVLQFMGEEIAQCCTFVIKCSQNLVNVEETPKKVKKHLKRDIMKIIKDSLDTYLKKRDCFIPFVLFKQTLQMNWVGNIGLVNHLITAIFEEDIRPFRRSQGVELLKIFYSNHRLLTNNEEGLKEEIIVTTRDFLQRCSQFFTKLVENTNSNIKEKFISFLFSLITTIKHSPIKCEEFDWKSFGEIIREYRSFLSISQDTRKSFSKLCAALGVSNVVKMQNSTIKLGNKIEDETSSIASSLKEKKKNKHKKNNEKLKLKKEAKEERMKSLSEGLQGGFNNIGDMNGMEIEDTVRENGNSDSSESRKRKLTNDKLEKSKRNKT